jgi:tetratricopeptide (TPR) repeat protein
MTHHLVELEQKALSLQNAGKFKEAAELFAAIVKEQPDWEHGRGFYSLANNYEDSGQLEKAEQAYKSALRYQPAYDIFLGGYASFLYLHGDPERAFKAHLELLEIERIAKDDVSYGIDHNRTTSVRGEDGGFRGGDRKANQERLILTT